MRGLLPVLFALLWLATAAHAQLTLTYVTFPNAGTAGPRNDRNLPTFTINVTSPVPAAFPATFNLVKQDSGNITPSFLIAANAGNTETGNAPNSLFEGRNQILGQAVGADGSLSNVPAVYPSGLPIFVDVQTGPPNNPTVVAQSATGDVTQINPFLTLVTFNRGDIGNAFDVSVTGNVQNVPTPVALPGITPPAAGEAEARVNVALVAAQFSAGIIAPLTPSLGAITQPTTVSFAFPVTANPAAPGDYALGTQDFSGQASGIYEYRLRAQDVAGAASPATTSSIVRVNVDLVAPAVTVTFPNTRTLIIDGPTPPPGVTGDNWTLSGVVSDERQQGTTVTVDVFDTTNTNLFSTQVASQGGAIGTFALPLDFTPGGVIIPTSSPQDIRRLEIQSRDNAGNLSQIERVYVIRDQSPPPVPVVTSPVQGQGTSAPVLPFVGTIANVITGSERNEEHGIVRIRLTIVSRVNPAISTVVETVAIPTAAGHDSVLDNDPGFSIPADVLGTIPDGFTFTVGVNLRNFPFGPADVTAQSVDGVGNLSAPAAPITFIIGPSGPGITFDFENSGPDDNYQFIGLRTNQKGSDDGDLDGVAGFFVSLKSPERFDAGVPPSAPRPPLFLGGTDPGNSNFLILSGSASDVQTPVALITASGPGVPTTSFAPSPGPTVTFALPVDIRGLPEGVPTQINLQATNSDGTTGPSTSVVVFRDVVPARAPRITFPPLLTCLFGTGTIPCFFAGNTSQVVEGVAEPNALVVLSTPPTTGTISPPIPRTSNQLIPNPSSALSSLPTGFQSARADSNGVFRFASVNLSTVATSITTPVPVIFQAVDSFDNTDPVSSALAVGVFRLDQTGEVVRIRLDPKERNVQVFPGTPPSPVIGQFFGRERVQIEVTYSTVISQAPLLTVQQFGTVAGAARLIAPAGPGPITTQVLVYDYVAPAVDALFDGPATISISGGRDVFGFIPNAFNLSRAFFVDSVPPVLATTGANAFFPATGSSVPSIGVLSVAVEDRASSNGSTEASCVSTLFTRIKLLGPLETSPTREIPLTEPTPSSNQPIAEPCGTVTVTRVPVLPPTEEGTYEYRAEIGDNVGNVARFTSTFTLDRSPITTALIRCNPADGSTVTTLPRFGNQQAVIVTVFDLNVDLTRSSAQLIAPGGASIGQTSIGTGTNTIVVPLAAPLPGNGASDGPYQIASQIFDKAGNPSVPVTCTFILDTLPPQIFSQFPANFGCAGPPTRFVQATVIDTVPPNVPLPINSGVNLSSTNIKLRLLVPDPLNKTLAGTEIKGVKTYRTTTSPAAIVALEFVDSLGRVRALADDGSEDGRYRVEVTSADRAGNTTTSFGFFDHDAQPPQVVLNNFAEGSYLADTLLVMNGTVYDDGPCGLLQGATASTLSTTTVQVSIRGIDAQGREILPVAAPYFDFKPVTSIARKAQPAPFVKDEADWAFVEPIPAAPGRARLLVRAFDRAGNTRTITREIVINGGTLVAPVAKLPVNGKVTADKTVVFEWNPVTQARQYQLELTRVTPTPLTTTTTFPIDFPFNENFPPTVNGVQRPVDLVEFASTVAGGSPITTASVFSWRLRSLDVSLNPGPYSTPTTFVVDPTPPAVGRVAFGTSTASPPVVGGGTTPVTVFFAEDAGMDPSVPIEVFLQPRDLTIPPIRIAQTSYGRLRWDGTITLPIPGDPRDVNGRGEILIRGARNLAGRPLEDVRLPVDVNQGPFFQVRFFSNPAIPEELILIIKATANAASNVGVALASPPVVKATQHGHIVAANLPVNVIAGTPVANSTYRAFIRVDPKLIGFLDFNITGTDGAGMAATRTFGVTVAGALVLGGVRFPLVLAQAQASLPQGALPAGAMLVGVGSDQAPAGTMEATLARAKELGLTPAGEIGYVFPDAKELSAPLSVTVPLSALKLPAGVKTSQVGLYRAAQNGASTDFEWIGVPAQPGELAGSTSRLGFLGAFVDQEPPVVGAISPAPGAEVRDARMEVRAKFTDRASGIASDAITVTVDGQTYPARWDAATGEATWMPERPLAAGQHEIEVAARDRAGNEARSARFKLAVVGPLAIQQAVPVPNPVVRRPARIRYMLTKPADRVRVFIHDTAGRRLQTLEGPGNTGANTVEWDLDTRRGHGVANGVYLFTMEAVDGERTAKARGKIAVLQ